MHLKGWDVPDVIRIGSEEEALGDEIVPHLTMWMHFAKYIITAARCIVCLTPIRQLPDGELLEQLLTAPGV